ncbi:MAG: hypothetical protein ABJB97_09485, partial [Acidobacteriota bacterium]
VISEESIDEIEIEKPKRSRIPIYIVGGIIAVLLIGGLTWWFYSRQFEKTDDAFVEGNISLISPQINSHVTSESFCENLVSSVFHSTSFPFVVTKS